MVKEYSAEYIDPETKERKRGHLGPAYDPESTEFATMIRESVDVSHRAVNDFLTDAFHSGEPPGVGSDAARRMAETVNDEIDEDLYGGEEPDPTIALGFVEHIRSRTVELRARLSQERGESDIPGVSDAETVRKKEWELEDLLEEYERVASFLYSVHPRLTHLMGKRERDEWMREVLDDLLANARSAERDHEQVSNVQKGEFFNTRETFERIIRGDAVAADYTAAVKYMHESQNAVRDSLRPFLIGYSQSNDNDRAREEIFAREDTLFRCRQIIGQLEEERALLGIAKITK